MVDTRTMHLKRTMKQETKLVLRTYCYNIVSQFAFQLMVTTHGRCELFMVKF